MANKANEYPDEMLCPLTTNTISADDCLENQSIADFILKEESMPARFKEKPDWRDICVNCKYHEYS